VIPLVLAAAALAADYSPESTDWNGLAAVSRAAIKAGCPIEAREKLAWDKLTGTDSLWILYPRASVDGEKMAQFLQAGGRVVIGDDFGAADGALSRLDLARRAPAEGRRLKAARYYQDNPNLPEAQAASATALAKSTGSLVANHPAWFATRWPATFEFSPGAALVVEGALGRGRFVALADPSVLINNMQEIDGDRAFAEALVQATCRRGVDRIVLVTGEFADSGQPPATLAGAPEAPRGPADTPRDALNRALEDLGSAIAVAGASPPDSQALTALGAAAVVLTLMLLGRALRAPGGSYDGSWTRTPGLRTGRAPALPPWRFTLPATALRDEVMARVAEALGEPASLLSANDAASKLGRRFGDGAERVARALWPELARLPRPGEQAINTPAAWVTKKRLQSMHALAVALFDYIGSAS
jgi:hypothetical protein